MEQLRRANRWMNRVVDWSAVGPRHWPLIGAFLAMAIYPIVEPVYGNWWTWWYVGALTVVTGLNFWLLPHQANLLRSRSSESATE